MATGTHLSCQSRRSPILSIPGSGCSGVRSTISSGSRYEPSAGATHACESRFWPTIPLNMIRCKVYRADALVACHQDCDGPVGNISDYRSQRHFKGVLGYRSSTPDHLRLEVSVPAHLVPRFESWRTGVQPLIHAFVIEFDGSSFHA